MVELTVQYFMVDGKIVVPAELLFLECKVPMDGSLVETTKWMTADHWKELMTATSEILSSHFLGDDNLTSEPAFISTKNLQLAYLFKLNTLQKQILMNLQAHSNGDSVSSASSSMATGLAQHSMMLSVSVALADTENNTHADTFRSSLGCSTPSALGNKQPTINNFFPAVD